MARAGDAPDPARARRGARAPPGDLRLRHRLSDSRRHCAPRLHPCHGSGRRRMSRPSATSSPGGASASLNLGTGQGRFGAGRSSAPWRRSPAGRCRCERSRAVLAIPLPSSPIRVRPGKCSSGARAPTSPRWSRMPGAGIGSSTAGMPDASALRRATDDRLSSRRQAGPLWRRFDPVAMSDWTTTCVAQPFPEPSTSPGERDCGHVTARAREPHDRSSLRPTLSRPVPGHPDRPGARWGQCHRHRARCSRDCRRSNVAKAILVGVVAATVLRILFAAMRDLAARHHRPAARRRRPAPLGMLEDVA